MRSIFLHRVWTSISILALVCFVGCSDNADDEANGSNVASRITLNDMEYTAIDNSYFKEPVNVAYAFISQLKTENLSKGLIIYYNNYEVYKITDGEDLLENNIHIAFTTGAGSYSSSKISSNRTDIISGSITVVPFNDGHGLKFNNLKFTTSSNPDETFEIDGTIYYSYKILENPISR